MAATDEERDEQFEPAAPVRSLAVGYLAMVPLLAVYEWSLSASGGTSRNACELALSRTLAFLGEHQAAGRRVVLAALGVAAFALLRRRGLAIGGAVLRVALEGCLGAIVAGPLLVLLSGLLLDSVPALGLPSGPPAALPGLERTALVLGAGAYEEIVFRLGVYSALFLVGRGITSFLGAPRGVAVVAAELFALIGSSLAFAAFHLEELLAWLGPGGESFDAGRFVWRALAGVLFGALYRLRGAGVAAWTHGLFNVSLILGAGPGVYLS